MPRRSSDNFQGRNSNFGILIFQLMVDKLGKDPDHCELCGKPCKATFHHTKYDGATLYDIIVACMKCQNQAANKGFS